MQTLFLDYLAGVMEYTSDFKFQLNSVVPWLRHEVETNGSAFQEVGWTAEYAQQQIGEFESLALARLAERLRKGQLCFRDAISAWSILRRAKRAGIVSWGELGLTPRIMLKTAFKTVLEINRRPIIHLSRPQLPSADYLASTFPNVVNLDQRRKERLSARGTVKQIKP